MRTNKGKRLEAAFREGIEAAKGESTLNTRIVEAPRSDVKAIRNRFGSTQKDFAEQFGFSLLSVRDWEQGRRRPKKSARILLAMIDREPETVCMVLENAEITESSS